jgi:hypothetical protein
VCSMRDLPRSLCSPAFSPIHCNTLHATSVTPVILRPCRASLWPCPHASVLGALQQRGCAWTGSHSSRKTAKHLSLLKADMLSKMTFKTKGSFLSLFSFSFPPSFLPLFFLLSLLPSFLFSSFFSFLLSLSLFLSFFLKCTKVYWKWGEVTTRKNSKAVTGPSQGDKWPGGIGCWISKGLYNF